MMTTDFLIGAIRASRDLHPQVKTELEEILHKYEQYERQNNMIVVMPKVGRLSREMRKEDGKE